MKPLMTALLAVIFTILACIVCFSAIAQNPPDYGVQSGYGSSVNAFISKGKTLYIGGEFDYIGFYNGSMVQVDIASGNVEKPFPIVNGAIRVMKSDGAGGYYIGGDFSRVQDYQRNGLAHILSNGTLDPAWIINTNPGGKVYAMTFSPDGQTLFVGGDFTSIGGQNKNALAAINLATRTVNSSWGPGAIETPNPWVQPPATVSAIVYFSGTASDPVPKLFIGGYFTKINSVSKAHLAALSATNGAVLPAWRADVTPVVNNSSVTVFPVVRTLLYHNSMLYVGGAFSQVICADVSGTFNRYSLAAVSTGNGWVDGFFNGGNTRIYPQVYTSTVNGGVVNCIEVINNSAGVPHLGIGGKFQYEGLSTGLTSFVLVEPTGGNTRRYTPTGPIVSARAVDTTFTPGVYDPGEIFDFEVTGSMLTFAGDFEGAYGSEAFPGTVKVRRNLARMDMSTCIIENWFPVMQTNLPVRAISIVGGKIHVAGSFTSAGGALRRNLAMVDLENRIVLPFNPKPNSYVNKLMFSTTKDTLYVGGNFTVIDNLNRGYTAAIRVSDGAILPWATTSSVGGGVQDFAIDPVRNIMFVGGKFTHLAGQPRNHFAALNSLTGALITNCIADVTTINPQITPVRAVTLSPGRDTLYVGGRFNTIAGQSRLNLAAFLVKPTTSPVGATVDLLPWNFPVVNGLPDVGVTSLLIADGRLYVGGKYMSIGGNTNLRHLSAISLSSNSLVTSWAPVIDQGGIGASGVWCMQSRNGRFYFGGDFGTVNGLVTSFTAAVTVSNASIIAAFKPFPSQQPLLGGLIITLYMNNDNPNGDCGGAYVGGSQLNMREGVHDAVFHVAALNGCFEGLPPLPIKLEYFNAAALGSTALIQWKALGDAAEYVLQRSSDGRNFQSIGSFSNSANMYEDRAVEPGKTYYYRLQVTENGAAIYSPTRKVTIKANNSSLLVWMADDHILRVLTTRAGHQLQVFNSGGQVMINQTLRSGVNDVEIEAASGIYFYSIQKDGERQTGKVQVK